MGRFLIRGSLTVAALAGYGYYRYLVNKNDLEENRFPDVPAHPRLFGGRIGDLVEDVQVGVLMMKRRILGSSEDIHPTPTPTPEVDRALRTSDEVMRVADEVIELADRSAPPHIATENVATVEKVMSPAAQAAAVTTLPVVLDDHHDHDAANHSGSGASHAAVSSATETSSATAENDDTFKLVVHGRLRRRMRPEEGEK